jgi:hypothetical protein
MRAWDHFLVNPIDIPIAATTLDRPVSGMRIEPGATLADVLDRGEHTTLLVFLRHYG